MTGTIAAPQMCVRAVDFRAESDQGGDGHTLEGYAAVFDSPTMVDSWEGSFEEEIARGAFKRTLRQRTPVLQFDHGRDPRTGSVPIGSLREAREDEQGLFVSARLFDNPVVEPVRQAIEGGAISGMSFRFQVVRDKWRDNAGKLIKANELDELLWQPGDRGPLKRTIREVQLFELGPVVFPAYDATSVGVRSLLAMVSGEEREALIREVAARINDFPGRSAPRRTDGGDSDRQPGNGGRSTSTRKLARHAALVTIGVLK